MSASQLLLLSHRRLHEQKQLGVEGWELILLSIMIGLETDKKSSGKCYFTHGPIPVEIDGDHPPSRKPFSATRAIPYCHTVCDCPSETPVSLGDDCVQVELIMPDEAHDVIREAVLQSVNPARYATVFFPLSAILAPEFLATYIKTGTDGFFHSSSHFLFLLTVAGSIILISEGRAGIDNTFTVHDGMSVALFRGGPVDTTSSFMQLHCRTTSALSQ